jgi:osmotically-inducible protein OsmY
MKTSMRVIRSVLLVASVGIAAPAFVGCSSTSTRSSTGEYIDDSVITAKVKTALARDDRVNGFAVNVETFRGVVQLSGFVDSPEEKDFAAQAARSVSGVVDVQNNISLESPPDEATRRAPQSPQ